MRPSPARLLLAALLAGCAAEPELAAERPVAARPAASDARPPRLPFNPFAQAAVGDWQTLAVQITQPQAEPRQALRTFRVVGVEGDEVAVEAETLFADGRRGERSVTRFSRSQPPLVDGFGLDRAPLVGLETRPAALERSGRRFDCVQLRWRTRAGDRECATALAVHPEVKGMGLVGVSIEIHRPDQPTARIEWALEGYGTAQGTTWGRSEGEVTSFAPEAGAARSSYRDPRSGVSLLLPRFPPVGPGEVARPLQAWVPLGAAGPGEVAVEVVGTGPHPPTPEAIRAQVEARCAEAGMRVLDEHDFAVGADVATVFECAGAGRRLLHLALPGAPRSVFVSAGGPEQGFREHAAALEACLASLRVGPGAPEAPGTTPLFRDEAHGLSIRLPERALPGTGVALRFTAPPVLGAVTEMVEVIEVPGDLGLDEVVESFTDGASLTRWEERVVAGREARLLEVAAASNGAQARYRMLAVRLDDRALLVSCGSRAERFERWAGELGACLDSLSLR